MLAIVAGCGLGFDKPHPSDQALIQNFQSHEADFDLLVRMAQEDSKVVRIAPDFTWLDNNARWPRPESEIGFSTQRWNDYRRLFKKLDLSAGILNYNHDFILLLASTQGLVTGGSGKGYAYCVKEPSPIIESLDNFNFKDSKREMNYIYRKLKGTWYLFYEVSG
jgi:hypothetical protein